MFRKIIFIPLALLIGLIWCQAGWAALWEMTARIGHIQVYAQMEDSDDPQIVLLRVENMSGLESVKVSRHFVQMTDSEKQRVQPISADEVVSEYLYTLRQHMPQHAREIDTLLGEIQADFPQEKIVEVYSRLKNYMTEGKPITWRTNLENTLLGKRHATKEDFAAAEILIEKIGKLSKNYFWPTNIAPDTNYTGLVFFEQTFNHPVTIYFQMGEDFIGAPMKIIRGDSSSSQP